MRNIALFAAVALAAYALHRWQEAEREHARLRRSHNRLAQQALKAQRELQAERVAHQRDMRIARTGLTEAYRIAYRKGGGLKTHILKSRARRENQYRRNARSQQWLDDALGGTDEQ